MENNNIAVIDIGSNSVRYMLYNSQITVNKKLVSSTVLAEGLQANNTLNSSAIARTVNAVCDYVLLAKKSGANKIYIFATEAVRAAKNATDFTDLVLSKTNIAVDVVSGALEARLGFSGICSSCKVAATAIDIGGASVELTSGFCGKITYSKSLPIGLVRLRDLLGDNRQIINDYIAQKVLDFNIVEPVNNIVAIGGTATSVASMLLGQKTYNQQQTHGYAITLGQLQELQDKIYASKNIMQDFATLSANRAKIIGHGVIMLTHLLTYLHANKLTVSELDNMEGYINYKNNTL